METIQEFHKLDYEIRVRVHLEANRLGLSPEQYLLTLSEEEIALRSVSFDNQRLN